MNDLLERACLECFAHDFCKVCEADVDFDFWQKLYETLTLLRK